MKQNWRLSFDAHILGGLLTGRKTGSEPVNLGSNPSHPDLEGITSRDQFSPVIALSGVIVYKDRTPTSQVGEDGSNPSGPIYALQLRLRLSFRASIRFAAHGSSRACSRLRLEAIYMRSSFAFGCASARQSALLRTALAALALACGSDWKPAIVVMVAGDR